MKNQAFWAYYAREKSIKTKTLRLLCRGKINKKQSPGARERSIKIKPRACYARERNCKNESGAPCFKKRHVKRKQCKKKPVSPQDAS